MENRRKTAEMRYDYGKKFAKTLVGIGAAAVAGKVAYDKYKTVKEAFTKEENESVDAEVKKYNAIFEKKVVEVEDEEFSGCEIKTVGAKAVLDLGLAVFEKTFILTLTVRQVHSQLFCRKV